MNHKKLIKINELKNKNKNKGFPYRRKYSSLPLKAQSPDSGKTSVLRRHLPV